MPLENSTINQKFRDLRISVHNKGQYLDVALKIKAIQTFIFENTGNLNFRYTGSSVADFLYAAERFRFYSDSELKALRDKALFELKSGLY